MQGVGRGMGEYSHIHNGSKEVLFLIMYMYIISTSMHIHNMYMKGRRKLRTKSCYLL